VCSVLDQTSCRHRGIPHWSPGDRKPAVKLSRASRSLNKGGGRLCYRLVGSLFVLLITCASAIGLTTSDLDPSHHYKLEKIDISGERAFSRDETASVMTAKERPWYQIWKPLPEFFPQTLNDDLNHILRFYQAHGYYSAHVTYDLTVLGDRIVLHITIKEGKPVRIIALQTNVAARAPSPQALEPSFKLPFKKGDIFEQKLYQEVAQTLSVIYTSHSYAHAIVHRHAIVDVGRLQARVWYDVNPGVRCVFGNTSISGTRQVSPQLVQEQLTYKSGEPFDSRKLSESRATIVALNVFSAVDVVPRDNPSDQAVVPILISLQEGPKHTLNAGLGYNTQTQLNAMIGFNDYNFLGGGRQFSLTGTYSDVRSALDARLFQPRFLSPKSSLTLEASQQQQTYQTYTGNISGFDPHVDYKFSSSLTGSVGWRLEYLKFNSVNSSTIKAIGGFRRNGILSGPMAGLTFDNTEDPLNPRRGEKVSLVANISDHSLGGDYRYWRVLVEARKYRLIGWRTVLATRLKVGLSDTLGKIGDVPLSERFYSGGEGSVRGYGPRRIGPLSESNDPLGGLSLIEGAVELRRPLFWKLDGALFFDCGQVATKPYDLRVDALQCGYGPAAGMNSPVGPINVYLGFPTQKPRGDSFWQFYFSIGQYF
jgi:outer membrane protein assembly complex protein YaeT